MPEPPGEWRVDETVQGRSAIITYSEGENVLTMYGEIGGANAFFIVSGPPPQEWVSAVPWAAERRREVMERVAAALISKHPGLVPSFGDDYTTIVFSRRPKPPRNIGHWLLLILSIAFFAEEYVFFVAALHNASSNRATGVHFLILAIGVFLTAIAALHGFGRRIRAPWLVFFGLIAIQPAISYVSELVRGSPRLESAATSAAIAVILLGIAINENRPRKA